MKESARARPAVLVIAATDSSGGAGLARDVRVLSDFSVDALCAITAVTAQTDVLLGAVHHIPPEIVRAQILAAFATRRVGAVKIGMLGCRATVEAVVESLPPDLAVPIVLDPVLATSSGGALIDADGLAAMRDNLFPRVTLLTPNIPEAAVLVSADAVTSEPELIRQAQRILDFGVQAVFLKGGHGEGEESVDLLISRTNIERLVSARVRGASRGTGCALASAIAAGLASSASLSDASEHAKRYVAEMLNPER